jgi:NAD(P)-dependent dehydrogenase (short-subunit alcohol dehydrogenase family)
MSNPTFSLHGKTALVTGSRRGIGKTIAMAMAEAGADVALCDVVTDDGQIDSVARQIESFGRRSLVLRADTSRKSDVEALVRTITDRFGVIDVLVNNAGVNAPSAILDLDEETWDHILDVDLKGYFLCAQAVGKRMVERKRGVIINIASQFAFKATPGVGAYCIAKAGVVMLTRVLAQELGKAGIRANAIAPGMVRTEFNQAIWGNPEMMGQILPSIPLGRMAETTDLVGTVLFLASDASSYMTGHTLLVDGGRSA